MVIGKLNVLLGLNSAQFNTGMAAAGRPVRTFKREIETSAFTLANLQSAMKKTAVVLAAAGAAAMAAAVVGYKKLREEMQAIDKIAKSAAKFGMGTEALVGLQHAADLAGVDIGALEKAISRMQRTLSEASLKAGLARDSLAQLRIDPAAIAGIAPDEAFLQIADALVSVENQTDRVRLAMEIFGRSGADLLPLLQDGATAIRATMEDAKRLGMTFSALDARQVERANDAMTRLDSATGRLKRVMAIEFAPVLEMIANKMVRWLTESDSKMKKLGDSTAETIPLLIAGAAEMGRKMDILLNKFASGALQLHYRITQWGHMFFGKEADPTYLDTVLDEIVKFDNRTRELERQDWGKRIADQIREIREAARASLDARTETQGLLDLEAIQEEQRAMDELRRRGEQLASGLRTPFEVLQDRMADANKLLEVGAINWQTYGREVNAVYNELLKLQQVTDLPSLVERGSQEDYASGARWQQRAMEREARDQQGDLAPQPTREDQTRELLKMLGESKKILAAMEQNTRSTSASTRRTATAVERTEQPEVVDM